MKANLKLQLEAFEKGIFLESDMREDTGCFVFYDWFCKKAALKNKAITLFRQVKRFVKNMEDINTEQVYVFFKNNCPMNGPLYDSFSICDYETGDVLYWVTGKSGHSGEAEIVKAPNFGVPWKSASTYTKLFIKETENKDFNIF